MVERCRDGVERTAGVTQPGVAGPRRASIRARDIPAEAASPALLVALLCYGVGGTDVCRVKFLGARQIYIGSSNK